MGSLLEWFTTPIGEFGSEVFSPESYDYGAFLQQFASSTAVRTDRNRSLPDRQNNVPPSISHLNNFGAQLFWEKTIEVTFNLSQLS
jgi:hypothetical protein